MVQATKEIARLAQDMVAKSGSGNVSQLGPLGAHITHLYTQLAMDTQGAVAKTTSVEIAMRIKSTVHDLGQGCIDIVKTGGARQGAPDDAYAHRDLTDAARVVGEKVCIDRLFRNKRANLIFFFLNFFLGFASLGRIAGKLAWYSSLYQRC